MTNPEDEGRTPDTLFDEMENVYNPMLPGSDDMHGWDIYLGWDRVTNAEMLMEWLELAGQSLDEFKQEQAYRANVDKPGFEWLRDV